MPLSVEDGKRLIEVEAQLIRLTQGGGQDISPTRHAWPFERVEERINAEEAKYPNIPRGLAKAVAYQESAYNPDARGDGGQAQSFFQLHPGAAKDAGIDPAQRGDPERSIQGGVKYLSMKIAQAKGDIPTALSLYNRGTPDYRGVGDPNYIENVYKHYKPAETPAQQPGILARVSRALSPASTEAATSQATPPATGGSRLEEIEAELARRDQQATLQTQQNAPPGTQPPAPVSQTTPPTTTPPGARQAPPAPSAPRQRTTEAAQYFTEREGRLFATPELIQAVGELYRGVDPLTLTAPELQQALARAQQIAAEKGGASGSRPPPEAAPAAPEAPAATPGVPAGVRFQALPSIQQLPPAERVQRAQEFAALRPDLQAEFLRGEEPPSDLTVDIAKPSPSASRTEADRQARVREELAAWEQQAGRPWREGDPRMPSEKKLGVPDEKPVTEGWTKPETLIPLILGLGIPGLTIAAPGAAVAQGALSKVLPKAGPLITRGARAVGEALSQTAGWTAGRTAETGAVPSPGAIGAEAGLNVLAGGVVEGLGATGQAILRRSQAGKAIAAADEATTAARAQWQADTQAAEAAAKSQQKELYDTAVIKAKASQRDYEMAARARQQKIDAGRQEYDEAVRAQQADDLAKEQSRQQTIAQQQQTYQQAVTGQEQAITQARVTPGKYTPETPSWVMYEKFGDAAKDAVVDLTPAKAALAEVRASRGVLPDGTIRPFPQAVESIAANLEKATGDTSFKTIREELRRLGPLTKSQDGNVRGAAKQLYGIYADVLEASPVANDLLRNANATFRKEMAVQDIADWLKPGHGIVRIDKQGRETINVGALMTRLEKTVADDSLFRRSFAPDELDALRTDLRKLAGTPDMPRGMPRAPAPVVPGSPPAFPREPAAVALPGDVRVKQVPLPAEEGATGIWPTLQTPAQPGPTTPREMLGERPKVFKGLTKIAARDYLSTLIGLPPGLVAGSRLLWRGGQQLRYGVARSLLSDSARPMMLRALQGGGTVSPRLYGTMVQGLSDAERKALLRDTRETRERRR